MTDKKLKGILEKLNKDGLVVFPAETPAEFKVKKIPFGNMLLDVVTRGGAPQGRLIRIFGPYSAGKTQIALNIYKANLNRCHNCWELDKDHKGNKNCWEPFRLGYVDLENSYDPSWLEKLGIPVNPDPDNPNIYKVVPNSGEQAVDVVDVMIRTRMVSVLIIDSLAAMLPSIEAEKEAQESIGGQMGIAAKLLNSGMRKWTHGLISSPGEETKAPLIVCINQIRETMDQYSPETTPGGQGQVFASSLDIRLERKSYRTDKGKVKGLGENAPDKGNPVAQLVRFQILKSKISPSGRVGEFWIWQADDPTMPGYGPGMVAYGASLMEYATRFGVIEKKEGEYVTSDGETLGSKKDEAEEKLFNDLSLQERVIELIRERILNGAES